MTEHTKNAYWCSHCRKIVTPTVTAALPNSNLGLRLVVYTAWLYYMVGVSVNDLVKMLFNFSSFPVSASVLTQARSKLAGRLQPE